MQIEGLGFASLFFVRQLWKVDVMFYFLGTRYMKKKSSKHWKR